MPITPTLTWLTLAFSVLYLFTFSSLRERDVCCNIQFAPELDGYPLLSKAIKNYYGEMTIFFIIIYIKISISIFEFISLSLQYTELPLLTDLLYPLRRVNYKPFNNSRININRYVTL